MSITVAVFTVSSVVEVYSDDFFIPGKVLVGFTVTVVDLTDFAVGEKVLSVVRTVEKVCVHSLLENLRSKNLKPAIGLELVVAHLIRNKS